MFGRFKFNIPGKRYCGPGTDIDKAGEPLSELDAACEEHDLLYSLPDVPTKVADEQFIKRLENIDSLKAWLLSRSISLKKNLEEYTGIEFFREVGDFDRARQKEITRRLKKNKGVDFESFSSDEETLLYSLDSSEDSVHPLYGHKTMPPTLRKRGRDGDDDDEVPSQSEFNAGAGSASTPKKRKPEHSISFNSDSSAAFSNSGGVDIIDGPTLRGAAGDIGDQTSASHAPGNARGTKALDRAHGHIHDGNFKPGNLSTARKYKCVNKHFERTFYHYLPVEIDRASDKFLDDEISSSFTSYADKPPLFDLNNIFNQKNYTGRVDLQVPWFYIGYDKPCQSMTRNEYMMLNKQVRSF
jgi:hypothetical protein